MTAKKYIILVQVIERAQATEHLGQEIGETEYDCISRYSVPSLAAAIEIADRAISEADNLMEDEEGAAKYLHLRES